MPIAPAAAEPGHAPAHTVWLDADIVTLDPAHPRAQALAVAADGRLLAVGSNADALAWAGPATHQHCLAGQFVMPGLIDTHVHATMGAVRDLFEVNVGLSATIPALLDAVAQRARQTPPGQWISGGFWHMDRLLAAGIHPRQALDAVAPQHPVVLRDATYHNAWANSRALQQAGISAHTPDPEGGQIRRGPDGREPDGVLIEFAQGAVLALAVPTPAQMAQAVAHVQGYFHGLGITGIKEAMAAEPELTAWADADRAGLLKLHTAMHLVSRSPLGQGSTPLDTLLQWRQRFASAHVHTGFIKMFLDGVAPSRTAAFFEPYLPCDGCAPGPHDPDAQLLIPPDELALALTEFDRLGFVVKMHAVGDRAARAGLDAIAAARLAHGQSGLRHEIGHAAFITAQDHARFAPLGAVAEVSPRLWFPNPITAGQYRVLGPVRTQRCHAIRSLLDAGAELTYGSDWPAAAADANPWLGLAGMLSRRHPFGLFEGTLGPEQAITLDQALPLFTTNAARAMGLQQRTGRLAAGLSADFIVLARPLAGLDMAELAATLPLRTVFEGQTVHQGPGIAP